MQKQPHKENKHFTSLFTNTAWAVSCNLIYAGGRFVIIVLLTKFYTSSQVGQVALALAIVTPLSFLFNMELLDRNFEELSNLIKSAAGLEYFENAFQQLAKVMMDLNDDSEEHAEAKN